MNNIGDCEKIFGYKVLKLPLRFTQILLIEEYDQYHWPILKNHLLVSSILFNHVCFLIYRYLLCSLNVMAYVRPRIWDSMTALKSSCSLILGYHLLWNLNTNMNINMNTTLRRKEQWSNYVLQPSVLFNPRHLPFPLHEPASFHIRPQRAECQKECHCAQLRKWVSAHSFLSLSYWQGKICDGNEDNTE